MTPEQNYLREHGEPESPPSGTVSHAIRILRGYLSVIALALLGVLLVYALVATILYLVAGKQEITSQPFRLDFAGAATGRYPNGMKFSATEIISSPTVLKVFNDNEIKRFATFPQFERAIYILEANRALELLSADYQARLSDPKLSPVDRERMQREFEMKRESLGKNEFSLNFQKTGPTAGIPEPVVKKVLVDILSAWAHRAINDQHVVSYRVPILSPNLVDQTQFGNEPLVAVHVLRSRVLRVLENIDALNELPASDLARTRREKMSLAETRVRLEEVVRFRLDPLVSTIVASGRSDGRTIRFIEDQLAYDQRWLQAAQDRAATIRDSLSVYSNGSAQGVTEDRGPSRIPGRVTEGSETVMPQLSDGFLERIVNLANNAADRDYRQKLVGDYREAAQAIVPIEQAVAYDRAVLGYLRSGSGTPTAGATNEVIASEASAIRTEVQMLVTAVNEIYQELSANLNPSTELYSLNGPAGRRVFRSFSFSTTAAFGVLTFLLSIPVILAGCLIHHRVRQEDDAEAAEPRPNPGRI